jgi:chitin disaccharide deacetylase
MERRLIVNADDFGLSEGVNRGVLRAYSDGILTSASLLVRSPAARDGVRSAGDLDLGLHLDFGEWAFRDGAWIALYERASLADPNQVAAEARTQLKMFLEMTGKTPTHLDSHQHVHMQEPALSVAKQMAEQLAVPLRGCSPRVHYCGDFYGQSGRGDPHPEGVSVKSLVEILAKLRPGVTELACHPGVDAGLASAYAWERSLEVKTLCDSRIRETIVEQRIQLSTFADLLYSGGVKC